ncbi:nucleotide exchange factor GrpE [Candidatus Uhrbacteria bacterium]|nr:nucleotide exchange factor GrpE [Candidatus Uhrbacteria bacterium]
MDQKDDQQKELHECDAIAKQAEEYLNGWKRAKADLINFQRETEKRQSELLAFAHAGAAFSFLPIVETLEKAIAHIPLEIAGGEWAKGLTQISKQCSDLLKDYGIEKMETIGKLFSVEFHEAVGKLAVEGSPPGTIVEEAQAGYTMHGKVLRHAKVIVAEEQTT